MATAEAQGGVTWLAEMAKLKLPEETIEDTEDRTVIQRYTPLGVVAAIVPWNFPIQLGLYLSLIIGTELTFYSMRQDRSRSPHWKLHHRQAFSIHTILRSQAC